MRIHRRSLLAGLAASPAAFLLPDIRRAAAQMGGIPKRFVVYFSRHGTWWPDWKPLGAAGAPVPTRNGFELGLLHKPLERWKQKMIVLDGLSVQSTKYQTGPGGNAHIQGAAHMLTGMPMVDPGPAAAGGPSLEQYIAQTINAPAPVTRIPAVYLSPNGDTGETGSWLAARQKTPGDGDPQAVFKRLFPAPVGMMGAPDPIALQNKSILDFQAKEMRGLGARLPKTDRARLEQHAQALSDLGKRIALPTVSGCSTAAAETALKAYRRYGGNDGKPLGPFGGGGAEFIMTRLDAQARNLQAAFACDVTRVAFYDAGELAPDAFAWPAPPAKPFGQEGLHGLAHFTDMGANSVKDPGAIALMRGYHTKHADTLSTLLGYLDEIKEADGRTLLDHTIVLWVQDVGSGNHSCDRLPWMLFGSGGGALTTGRYLDVHVNGAKQPHNKALTSLAQIYGAKTQGFGDTRVSMGRLEELHAA
jgi:hypothetical protein